jgi:hypothetical protein
MTDWKKVIVKAVNVTSSMLGCSNVTDGAEACHDQNLYINHKEEIKQRKLKSRTLIFAQI